MENHIQTEEKLTLQEKQVQDNHNDEYWAKKYDISVEELQKADKVDISTLIIEAGKKHNTFSL